MIIYQGVISLLDGDTQSIPGWQNRAFANIVRPVIPQRVEVTLVQLAFSPLRIPSLISLWRHDKGSIHMDEEESLMTDSFTPSSSASNGGSSWLPLQSRYKAQPPPRFLKLPEEELKEIEIKSKELNSGDVVKEELPSSAPIIGNELNSTNEEITQEPIEPGKDVIDQSDTAPNTPNTNERVENRKTVNGIEPQSGEGHSHLSAKQESDQTAKEEQYNHANVYNTNHNSQHGDADERMRATPNKENRKPVARKRSSIVPKQENTEFITGNKSRTHSKQDNENTTEGNRTERVQRPQWFDDDDDDDEAFSTRLGSINMKEHREFMLPKQTNVKRQGTPSIIV